MANKNQKNTFIITSGNIGADPELGWTTRRDTDPKDWKPQRTCKFSVASTEFYNGKELTAWYQCTAYGRKAEAIGHYLRKGSGLFVTGYLTPEPYRKKNGEMTTALNVNVESTIWHKSAKESSNQGPVGDDRPEDLPF